MRATIPPGREEEAINAVMAHGPLYVPKSMASEAQKYDPSARLAETFRSGFLDPELFKQTFGPIFSSLGNWLSDDVTPGMQQAEMQRQTRGQMDRRVAIQPAPAYIQNSDALNLAREYEAANAPPGTKTQDQAEHTKAIHSVENIYRTKNVDKPRILQMIKDGKITEGEWFKAQMRSGQNPLAAAVRGLSIEQALNVYAAATPEEKKVIALQVERKAAKISTDPS